jgi:hypothetical protein
MSDPAFKTTDLVSRLRRGVALDGGGHHYTKLGLLDEAAAEIERLQTLNTKMLRALDAIAEAYLGLEEIRNGRL